jgi:hypothetical protein
MFVVTAVSKPITSWGVETERQTSLLSKNQYKHFEENLKAARLQGFFLELS